LRSCVDCEVLNCSVLRCLAYGPDGVPTNISVNVTTTHSPIYSGLAHWDRET